MRRSVIGLAIVMLFAAGDAALAQSAKVGTLSCIRPDGEPPPIIVGIPPRIPLDCTFRQIPARGSAEAYRPMLWRPPFAAPDGAAFVLYSWNVFAGAFTGDVAYGPGVLAGGYSPATGDEPVAQGLGGQVLIGGAGNEIALIAASRLEADVTALELLFCSQPRC